MNLGQSPACMGHTTNDIRKKRKKVFYNSALWWCALECLVKINMNNINSLTVIVPVLWNSLPLHLYHSVHSTSSPPTSGSCISDLSSSVFLKKLKLHLFRIWTVISGIDPIIGFFISSSFRISSSSRHSSMQFSVRFYHTSVQEWVFSKLLNFYKLKIRYNSSNRSFSLHLIPFGFFSFISFTFIWSLKLKLVT